MKWFAPILVFTTEEIFTLVSKTSKSIHELDLPKINESFKNSEIENKWTKLFKLKQEANIAIEQKRANKEIGSSLEAELKITTDNKNFELLEGIDMAEYFITSKAEKIKSKNKEELKIEVTKSQGVKCPRCWKILDNKCARCENAIVNKI